MRQRVTLSVRVWIEMIDTVYRVFAPAVTLSVRVWIEIFFLLILTSLPLVTLSVRVWIEIGNSTGGRWCRQGSPSV